MNDREDEKFLKAFGENLKKIRNGRNLSTRQLADLAEINLGNLSDIELGKKDPRLTTILALADALQVDPAVLVSPK
jgi:transcriptional regulator with XRE-family HTH domain